MNVELKWCPRCEEFRPREAFGRHKGRDDGRQDYCKSCAREYAKLWDQRKRQERRELKNPAVPDGFKRCRGCGEVKPHGEWHRNATASDGLSTRCKACRAVQGRKGHLKRQYGMTEAEREEMIASQMGICVICLKAPAAHVDHCHDTGRVRGVLCFNCNSAIGKLGDDPDTVRRAAAYLEGNAWKPTLVAPGVYQLPS
ncbi:endonuclease VII domain-containing protein [Streptomyces durmitorensis]|uniref:Endonuclease VII domain-containing protein n=1 Tax=Streptomyces durmitorensis TaxID=319947 RepID=A0ABY4Q3K5_9ACTN|nr:endonuclease VII domain-containing protein [Streptomyces durmitorensis]UQT59638.1 endonuclease VII domain-containing protein [Streptomyces durmitorensis]